MVPMAKVRELGPAVMEREEAKEVAKVFATIMASLDDFERARIEEWSADLEDTSEKKLLLPLLVRGLRRGGHDPADDDMSGAAAGGGQDPIEQRLLSVNFDPALTRLLREVKYFLLLDLDVPQQALDIYQNAKTFRKQTGALELMVHRYNQMMQEMLPVEAPLLRQQIQKIDQAMQKGLHDLTWKSPGIDVFVEDVQSVVRDTHT